MPAEARARQRFRYSCFHPPRVAGILGLQRHDFPAPQTRLAAQEDDEVRVRVDAAGVG